MHIRDAVASRQSQRAVQGVFLLLRSRNARCEIGVPLLFLRRVEYAENKDALLHARLASVLCFHFSVERIDNKQCVELFRFTKPDLERIVGHMDWTYARNNTRRRRYSTNRLEAFCILTRRICTPSRRYDLQEDFGKHYAANCKLFCECLEFFYGYFRPLCSSANSEPFFHKHMYVNTRNLCGKWARRWTDALLFIDDTNLFMDKPRGVSQRATYSGHKCRKLPQVSSSKFTRPVHL